MRVPVSWLRSLVSGLDASAEQIAVALVRAGLEVEQVQRYGDDVSGVVVASVLDVEELTGFKKPVRFCHVDTGSAVHEVVCGATNFAAGDRVAFAAPGATLPGGIAIAARQTYGHTSDGMICSGRELGLSDDHAGILVLPPDSPLGQDVAELAQLRDEVLDVAVTPDRGYALSLRGMAREVATAFGLDLCDPALVELPDAPDGPAVRLDDPTGCDRYVARTVTGIDPAAVSPPWLQRRLTLCGMRPVSLGVDITNHVMLELGQPLHAFDLDRIVGDIVVRRAKAGERLQTLDGKARSLDPEDLVITDDSGPLALAGVMGGAATEVGPSTSALLIESAHFLPQPIARAARRHRLPSEASRRYERGVDPDICAVAAEAAVSLLVTLGGGTPGGRTDAGTPADRPVLRFPVALPERLAGRPYSPAAVRGRLEQVGCRVDGESDAVLRVTPPGWRPDLTGPAELVEEVVRLEGYDSIPVALPVAPAGRGLTRGQQLRRTASRALGALGYAEVVSAPFVSEAVLTSLGADPDLCRLVNPLAETEAVLRPNLQPTLLAALQRNVSRGLRDVALFETGRVFASPAGGSAPVPGVSRRPVEAELAALDALLPQQPRHLGVALTGNRGGRPADWADAVEAVVAVGRALGLAVDVRPTSADPWHPGRCAGLLVEGQHVGFAGELHPRVVSALQLPEPAVTAEADLDALVAVAQRAGPVAAPRISPFPPAAVDVALVVPMTVAAADVEAALRSGAGDLLEDLRLFDVYVGPQVGEGRRSLAYALRLRAPDRTLTDSEVLAARDAAVAEVGRRCGGILRGT